MTKSYNEMYYNWLLRKIEFGDNVDRYEPILRVMHTVPFHVAKGCEMDKNRITEGNDLRYFFKESEGLNQQECSNFDWAMSYSGEATILEVLIALAERINNVEIGDRAKGNRTPDWFWRMFTNLGLTSEYVLQDDSLAVDILLSWMDRNFEPNGAGSPFPLKNPPADERFVEILYQMRAYINENFHV